MSGEYFSWLSHDDLYMPDKISSQIDYIESSTDHACEILYSDYCLFHQGTGRERNVVLENDRPAGFRSRLFFSNDVHGCTLLIPKSAFDKVGFFDESLKAVQDYDMWFRLATHFKFTRIPQVLVRGRVHEGQLGTQVPWRIAENRQLRESWIDKLTPTEVHMYTEKPEFISFYNAALHFGKRGFLYLSFRCFSRASKANSGFTSYQLPGMVLGFAYSFAYGFAYILYRDIKYKFIKVFS